RRPPTGRRSRGRRRPARRPSCDTSEVEHALRQPLGGELAVPLLDLDPNRAPTQILRGDQYAPRARERVQHQIARARACAHQLRHQRNRLRRRMSVWRGYRKAPDRGSAVPVEYGAFMTGEYAQLDRGQPEMLAVHWRWVHLPPNARDRKSTRLN